VGLGVGKWQVYDRAQVFVGSTTTKRLFVGTLERWSHNTLVLPAAAALAGLHIDILVLYTFQTQAEFI
jgi:beta-galactosidase